MFQGKTVLVTGGTGSFGKRFTRLLLDDLGAGEVRVLSRDELKQHDMRMDGYDDPRIRYVIADIRDRDRLRRAFRGVHIVVHAAALKQVGACEDNPNEAIRTNIQGAENIVDAAISNNVERVLAMSTDKATNPVNLYGATKLVMEKVMIQANGEGNTKFACVRYGNVVGSRGSVVHVFRKQLQNGELTITDPRMTRFWITLDQGTGFVADCITRMVGGEIFIPKLPSTNVMDVAEAVAPGVPTRIIGIRPGEKLHEVMVGEDEAHHTLDLGDRYCIQPLHAWWNNPHGGTVVTDDFRYDSGSNPEAMTVDGLRELIEVHVPHGSF